MGLVQQALIFSTAKRRNDMAELNCVCPTCGKRFHLKPSKVAKDKRHFCSRECFRIAKKEDMKGEKNHQFGLRGKDNASYQGDRITHLGYKAVVDWEHPFTTKGHIVLEHRLVAEKYLLTEENSIEINGKRYLRPDYIVHHKNHDRLDNRPENLEVMKKSDHSRLHAKEMCLPRNPTTQRFMSRGEQ